MSKHPQVAIVDSDPHHFESPPPMYTTDDIQAAKYARSARMLEWFRIGMSFITFAISLAVMACSAASLHEYYTSKAPSTWVLPMWPMNLDLRPTRLMLATGVIILVSSIAYAVLAFAPMRRKPAKLAKFSLATASLSFILALASAILTTVINNNLAESTSAGTLISWTCKWQPVAQAAPADYETICNNGNAAYDMTLLLVVLEFLVGVAAAAGIVVEGKMDAIEMRLGQEGGRKFQMV